MNEVEILILNGSPGSGKTTMANAVSEQLRKSETTHAVIDLDEFAIIYNAGDTSVGWLSNVKWKNLAAVWPNYITVVNKIIIPVVIDTREDLDAIKKAAPAKSLKICELVAPTEVLIDRVIEREPNDYWKQRLRGLVENYNRRSDDERFGDFRIATDQKSISDTAHAIIERLGW